MSDNIASSAIINELSRLSPETLLTEVALAEVFAVSTRTVRNMVSRYELPPPLKMGGRAMWRAESICNWIRLLSEMLEEKHMSQRKKILKTETGI